MNWWDNGYWILKLGRRIPLSNGTQAGAEAAARFYVSRDPADAAQILRERRARYVFVDQQLPLVRMNQLGGQNARFLAMSVWSGVDLKDYVQVYFQVQPDGSRRPLLVFHPAYYQSMLARLYLFNGEAASPENSTYIFSYRDQVTEDGEPYRTLQSQVRFETFEKAQEYLAARPGQNLTIGGLDPTRSCVPLERLDDYRLVYDSSSVSEVLRDNAPKRVVRLFEYLGQDEE